MEKEFVSYEIALKLKELGFDEPLLGRFYTKPKCKMFGIDEKGRHYPIKNTSKKLYILGEHFVLNDDNVTIAPLYQQVFKWFRDKHSLFHSIDPLGYNMCLGLVGQLGKLQSCNVPNYGTYEEAELECIKELIKIVKQQKMLNDGRTI